jgi:hypothetical protein
VSRPRAVRVVCGSSPLRLRSTRLARAAPLHLGRPFPMTFAAFAEELAAAKELARDGRVERLQEEDAGSGHIVAEVQGTEPQGTEREIHNVRVSLFSGGDWADASCSCPNGARTTPQWRPNGARTTAIGARCKHVGAALLKAAAWTSAGAQEQAVTHSRAAALRTRSPRPAVVNDDLGGTRRVVLDPDELVVRGEVLDEFVCSICMG